MEHNYDAIVIGAGMSGGFVAKELCDKGIKTLLLERGRDVKHIKDYPTTNMQPWDLPHRNQLTRQQRKDNPIAASCYAYREATAHFFANESEQPYIQEKPFDWIRGYQVGGKSILWARQVQRWSDYDFDGPARDGFAVDWPIRYKDLAPWYSHVEKFVGVSGNKDGLDVLPDGEFLKSFGMTCVGNYFADVVRQHYPGRHVIYGRCAHVTEVTDLIRKQGRGLCQSRTICERGCPFGGYFNANSTTIPWALRSGNLTLRPHSVVHSIIEKDGKATGVRVIDANDKSTHEYTAKVIFVNASTINTNAILLNSKSERFPNGLGNDSDTLGKYVAFHNYSARITAEYDGMLDKTTSGRRPTSGYIPRFRNVKKQETDFLRGYACGFDSGRIERRKVDGLGKPLRDSLLSPKEMGPWRVGSHLMGETIPKESNYVRLDEELKDAFGIPQIRINVDYDDNDHKMRDDFHEQLTDMYKKAGFTNIKTVTLEDRKPGNDIHEMGGVRMGRDAKTSMCNANNQLHACPNVYITDGACMTSTATQNPSLTFMALAARAANHAVEALKRNEI
ncbi:MAG: GMC family oxidoreductase [Bacteroidota bacterium]